MMIIDAHWDTALHLQNHPSLEHLPQAHCDWERFRKYLNIAFMAIFLHPLKHTEEEQYAQFKVLAEKLLADIDHREQGINLLRQKHQLHKDAKLALLGAEGGGFLGAETAAERLQEAYDMGLRLLGLTWNYSNNLAGGCFDGEGLTPLGRNIVNLCQAKGIIVDAAHLSAHSLKDVLSISTKPITVSHTACAALCPAWKVRNLLDWQLKAIRDNQGVVGICFVPEFIGSKPSLRRVAEHMAYAANLIGAEYIGLGSDFDGTTLPPDILGLQSLPLLQKEMADIGFNPTEIAQIMGQNFYRLLQQNLH